MSLCEAEETEAVFREDRNKVTGTSTLLDQDISFQFHHKTGHVRLRGRRRLLDLIGSIGVFTLAVELLSLFGPILALDTSHNRAEAIKVISPSSQRGTRMDKPKGTTVGNRHLLPNLVDEIALTAPEDLFAEYP